MTTDAQPPLPPQPPADVVWRPYPGNEPVAMYGHELVLRAFTAGWIRVLDADGTQLVALAGRGPARLARATFKSPDPDPGHPHFGSVELSADAFEPDGSFRGSYQLFRADQE